ncbi:MAG: hypothetical protein HZB80_01835 [Deltaproteobacteria bacterium]|nr:hypothetical protein [Deltaproteobacteria bacterium]
MEDIASGDRVTATLKKHNSVIGTWVVGALIIKNNSFFVRDDIYQKEVEVVPSSIKVIRKMGGSNDTVRDNTGHDIKPEG